MTKKKQTKKITKKKKLYCGKCGLVITIDKTCGCIDTCDLICCGQQLKEKK